MNKKIPYGRQCITDDDIKAVINTLQSDFLTQGPQVPEFESAFAKYVGSEYAVAVSNGTAALHLAALALNVSANDNVIVPPITFAASANCIRYCGGNVTFCDIDKDNYLIDLEKLEDLLQSKPKGYYKGIVPVDYTGYPVDGEKLKKIADNYALWIIEDACHAPGAYFIDSKEEKQKTGNGKFAELTCFSFHPVKHITTGEGGMITTNSKELYEKLLLLRTHGITKDSDKLKENHGGWYYEMQDLGYNYRLTDFQAALGISQLKRADININKRIEIANNYNNAFNNIQEIITPKVNDNVRHAYHLYVIQTDKRLELYNYLKQKGIFTQVHYIPVHLMPYYQAQGCKKGDFINSEIFYDHCLSLPMYPTLTIMEQHYVIQEIQIFFNSKTI